MGDTIAAVATARGPAALGIVRISGPAAGEVLEGVVPGTDCLSEHRKMLRGLARDSVSGAVLDEVLCFFSPGPGTATGEDVAEIHGHGGVLVMKTLLDAAIEAGARAANPGEFTFRAFSNGKIDLTQAEAVMTLIGARSDRAARAALKQLAGGLGSLLGRILNDLTGVAARIEAGLDFPDEDLPAMEMEKLSARLVPMGDELARAAASFEFGSKLTHGASVAIVGPANAGKSSLLNRLVGENRVLVDSDPGTTRDVVEAAAEIGGVPLRFLDTAGLRSHAGRLEKRGMEMTADAAAGADLLLIVIDGATPGSSDETALEELVALRGMSDADAIVVLNKSDLPAWKEEAPAALARLNRVAVSALNGDGISDLRDAVEEMLVSGQGENEVLLTTARQHAAVSTCEKHVKRAIGILDRGADPELAATDLRWARESLASLWGRNATDEVIEAIFSNFCLGK